MCRFCKKKKWLNQKLTLRQVLGFRRRLDQRGDTQGWIVFGDNRRVVKKKIKMGAFLNLFFIFHCTKTSRFNGVSLCSKASFFSGSHSLLLLKMFFVFWNVIKHVILWCPLFFSLSSSCQSSYATAKFHTVKCPLTLFTHI